jgi:hypothetical protein
MSDGKSKPLWTNSKPTCGVLKTPTLVKQEFYGLLLAHYAIRGLMHEAALKGDRDPDTLSFTHAVRVIRRKLPHFVSLPPSAKELVSSGRTR